MVTQRPKNPTRATLMNAFRPASEVEDPDLFAGREKQVRELTDALHAVGTTPVIYGHRGLGKSSLALQLRRIAMGDAELLAHINASKLALPEHERYLTLYVTCTDAVVDLAALLQALINAAESVELGPSDTTGASLIDRTSRKKLTLKVVEFESTKKYEVEKGRLSYQDLGLEEKLVQLSEILTAAYGQPVLFIIDELDRMKKTTGLASFIKAVSGPNLKFLLVGIAANLSELLADHQSLERSLVPVSVPLMSRSELKQIVTRAERVLDETGVRYRFNDDSKNRLAKVAAGFPWFVHVLGQSALLDVADRGEHVVQEVDIARAVLSVVDNRFAQQFSDMYQNAVRDSYAREAALRAFAKWEPTDIPTGEIYPLLKRAPLSIRNPSVYRGHLCSREFGGVLYTPVFQKRGLVRFANEMFKAYVRMRPSIFHGLDEAVDDAWAQRRG